MDQLHSNNPSETVLFPEMEFHYAGFWERFGAEILDGLILSVVNGVLQLALGIGIMHNGFVPTVFFFTIVLDWLYYALQEYSPAQATLGKRAVGLKVTTLSGERISFGQATGRFFGKYISAIILFIGYLMMLWDERKQTLHDKIAGTLVLKQPQ